MKQSVSLLETKRRALSPLFFLYLRSDSFNSHSFILKPILLIKATKSALFSQQYPPFNIKSCLYKALPQLANKIPAHFPVHSYPRPYISNYRTKKYSFSH